MAQIHVSAVNPTTVSWYVDGLSSPFNTTNYLQAILSNAPAINGSATAPTGQLDNIIATSLGSSTTTPTATSTGGGGFSGGSTYTLYGTMQAANGNYFTAGSAVVTMPSTRPSNYHWTYAGLNSSGVPVSGSYKSSTLGFYMTYLEWANFTSAINSFRAYKGYSTFVFTVPSSGGLFYASMFNEAINNISTMSPPTALPSFANIGGLCYASNFNQLIDSLNSIT